MSREVMQQDCRAYGELISAYLDDELSAPELAELADHLKRCPSCNRAMDDLMGVKNELHHAEPFWAKSLPGEGFVRALLDRLRVESPGESPARPPRGNRALPGRPVPLASWTVAAALTLLLILGVASFLFRPDPSRMAARTAEPAASFMMAQNTMEEETQGYLQDHAIVSSRNLLLDDELTVELVDHERP